jgi:hypothetical protein
MKTFAAAGFVLSSLLVTGAALADDKAACLDANDKAQTLRAAHQLVEAAEQLRICARAECPHVVQSDCVKWSAEVETLVPGVVVTAKNAAGADVIDVTVTVDGKPLMSKLTGQAVPTNGGLRTFHFVAADGSTADQQVLVKEGVKDQPVAVVLARSAALGAPGAVPGPASPASGGSSGSPLRTVGWVVGGVGVAGLIVGAVAGGIAVSDQSGAHCTDDKCLGSLSGAKSAATASTVGFVAGGVLVAGGVGLILFAPHGSSAPTTGVRLLPIFMANGGAAVVGGSF